MANTQAAMTYPSEEQYERWKDRAKEMNMSVSEFMQAMIEAGMKKFDATVEPDETHRELREQRNDLKHELDNARDRIQRLENRLYHSEREAIRRYVEENPGVTYEEIGQQIIDTAPSRVADHLDVLEGEVLESDNGHYYPAEKPA